MTSRATYPKRLIEVDLPIKRISAHARREKSIKHGHISTLHIWWARRPLAACRAVVLAALWPDPADSNCPESFRREAAARMRVMRDRRGGMPRNWENPLELRAALLDFIADFSNWDLSNEKDYLETSRALVQVAHESLGGVPGTRPLVVDPFAGGGAIPLEALRVGADVFSSDLNPVAVLINKVVLEYVPKYGAELIDEVRRWGTWVKQEAEKELAEFYPKDFDGSTPVAYIWARTIRCEGPACGADIPLMRSLWLAKKGSRPVALRLVADRKNKVITFEIIETAKPRDVGDGTMRKGSATCPLCDYTTPNSRVRSQLGERHGGSADARLVAVVMTRPGQQGRIYRLPTMRDLDAAQRGVEELKRRRAKDSGTLSLVPDESIPTERPSPNARGLSAVTRIGIRTFGDLFTGRQALALSVFARLVREAAQRIVDTEADRGLSEAIQTALACVFGKFIDRFNALARWEPNVQCSQQLFGRQALSIVWDFTELSPAADGAGSWSSLLDVWLDGIPIIANGQMHRDGAVTVRCANATENPLPNDSGDAFITDPPYYDAIPYADLSDFFYVWLRRVFARPGDDLWRDALTPKDEEAIWNPSRIYSKTGKPKDEAFYEAQMAKALADGRRVVAPGGVGVVVFAHKSTAGWEAILSALINAGWIATASWPIDTEMGSRVNAMGTASLASSVHIVCRPRETLDGTVRTDAIGEWRDVLAELPKRIHDWMPRLAAEGVVGADAIFACLGPALEIFSRYSRVEKASGEAVALREYLEQVWAAVAKEALAMIFAGADATGFEEDARLSAMWLWTLSTAASNGNDVDSADEGEPGDDEEKDESANAKTKVGGFVLEYDAARKIAQGLGAHLEQLASIIEVKGAIARLLPVAERTRSLFQKGDAAEPVGHNKTKKKSAQLSLGFVADLEEAEASGGWGDAGAPHRGETVLDRVHQSMILFGAGRGEALKRFLVDDGAGRDDRFWRLAQAFSALYPASTDEKRWVDGVLARKKNLGI